MGAGATRRRPGSQPGRGWHGAGFPALHDGSWPGLVPATLPQDDKKALWHVGMTGLFTLLPEAVGTIRADSKPAILEALATRFADVYELNAGVVLAAIEERERLGSTGFGRGVAIPHARTAEVARPVAVFLRLQAPVAFESADDMPVDTVFGLLSPDAAGAVHLHALAAISRMMRDDRMHQALNEAPSDEALYSLLSNGLDRDAA